MVKKLMRDSVTGKLMRDNATGKLMRYNLNPMGNDCVFCSAGSTPKFITLSVSGLIDCEDCFYVDLQGYFRVFSVASALNDAVITLEQTDTDPCIWQKLYENGNFGTLAAYSGDGCTGTITEYTIDLLRFRVIKCSAGTILIDVYLRAEAVFTWYGLAYTYEIYPPFETCKTATITDCIAVSNLANVLDCEASWHHAIFCEGGLVSIVEGMGEDYLPPAPSPVKLLQGTCAIASTTTGVLTKTGPKELTGTVAISSTTSGVLTKFWFVTQQKLPTGDSAVEWSRSAGNDNFALVDDPIGTPDDDSTYTWSPEGLELLKDLFSFTAFNVPAGSEIINVRVWGRNRLMIAGGDTHIRQIIKVDGIIYKGAEKTVYWGGYTNTQHIWTTNPDTGQPWTVDDVNGISANPLQTFGYEKFCNRTIRCTQTYIRVDYKAFG